MFNNPNTSDNNFFDDFLNEMTAANLQSQGDMSIVEFANRIIFNNDPDFVLYPTQRAILKSFYKETLTEEEALILKQWLGEDRTSWVKDRKYISLVLEAGRRSGKCQSASSIIPTTKGDITVQELHNYLTNKEKIGIYTYNFNNNIVDKYITYDIKTELNTIEQTYIVKTTQGKQEIVNEDHPFLTWDKSSLYPYWKKLKELKPDDFIAVSSNLPIFGEEEIEDNLLEAYAIILTTPSIYTLLPCPSYLTPFFKKGFSKKDLQELTVPINKILKLTQPKLKFFLSCILKYGDENAESSLLSLPIKTTKEAKKIKQNVKESFILVFWLKNFHREISHLFLKLGINFKIRENGIKLDLTTSKYTLLDVFGDICYNYPNLKKRLLKKNHLSLVEKENIVPPISTYNNSDIYHDYKKKRNYKKTVLKQVVLKQKNPDPKLLDWATNEINWEKIQSITPHKIEQTIALEVKGTNVIGSYIISHNSTMASIVALKEFYDLIILDNPHKKYGIIGGSPIAILVMAQSQAQVKETIFAAIRGYANNSRFFTSLQNKGIIEILSEEIRCESKNVSIYAKHTNSKSLVGYTLKCMLLDEVARFDTIGEEGKNKAFEIWENVAAGGSTFGHDFKKVAISSAWEPNDPIEILYNRAQKDPNTLAFKLTTFQVNLKLQKGITPVIVSDYTNDYIKARREYEGIRFNKFNTFIDLENLNKAATSVSIIDAIPCEIDTKSNAGTAHYAGIEITRIAENEVEDGVSFIHVDPALKKDSAALAIARAVKTENKWKIQIDALIKWEPHTDNNGLKRIVSFIDIEDKLNDISKVRRIGRITFDQWNCYQHNQLIQTPNGLKRVRDLKEGDKVISRVDTNVVVKTQIKEEVPTLKLTTKNGYEIEATYNHPILNRQNRFIELQDLRIEDKVKLYIPETEEVCKTPITKIEHESLILGYLIAEEDRAYENAIRFTNTEEEVKQDYADALNKTLPEYIFTATKKEIGLLLSGLYEGNSNITCFVPSVNYKKQSPRIYVELTTVSEQLSKEVQQLLLYLGIKSNRKKYNRLTPKGDSTSYFRISIYGQNIIKFKQAINFRSTKKKDLLNNAIDKLSFKRKSRVNYAEDSIVKIEPTISTIVHMEVSGDHTYCSEFINHNSASLIQKLQANGIDAQIASCSRENQFTYYTLFRDLLAHDYIILPKDSLWTNSAITELSELVLRPNRQIIHPTAGKDIADAIVNAVYQCHQHMIRTGLNLNMGINTNVVSSQSLAPLQRINITTPTKTKEQLKIGSAIDKLYNTRKKLK